MNETSVEAANALLSAISSRVEVGGLLEQTPAELGRSLGLGDPLITARAVRALLVRGRITRTHTSYRLDDPRPIDATTLPARGPRKARTERGGSPRAPREGSVYAEIGSLGIERLLELTEEATRLRDVLASAVEEKIAAEASMRSAQERARALAEQIHALEDRAGMAQSNLRSVLAAAKAGGGERTEVTATPVIDEQVEAMLEILRDHGSSETA